MARKGSRKRWNKRGGDGDGPVAPGAGTEVMGAINGLRQSVTKNVTNALNTGENKLTGLHNTGTAFVDENMGLAKGFVGAQVDKIKAATVALKGDAAPAAPAAPTQGGRRRRRSTKRKTARRSRSKRTRTTKRKRVRFSMRRSSKRRH